MKRDENMEFDRNRTPTIYATNKPNISDEDLNVNIQSEFSETDTIQRCPHDNNNPYTMIHNDLIRDVSISPECRWLIIYLLSNKEGWKINVKQVINHLKPHMGRNAVYKIFDEAIEAGYIKREEIKKSFAKKGALISGFQYFVSETPKFKKCLRRVSFRDTDDRDTENRDIKNITSKKNNYIKENTSLKVSSDSSAKADMPAKAGEIDFVSSLDQKEKKTIDDPSVIEIANIMVDELKKVNPEYNPPRNLTKMLIQIDLMLRRDKRQFCQITDVFKWALADSFWSANMFKPNPAQYLREKFDQLFMKMIAKPPKKERKFAPCSDDAKAAKMMQDMEARAL